MDCFTPSVGPSSVTKNEQNSLKLVPFTTHPSIYIIDAAKFYGTVAVRRMNWREIEPKA